nr:MAG TPA: hypothetical protein [Bacteriophage sp.]
MLILLSRELILSVSQIVQKTSIGLLMQQNL